MIVTVFAITRYIMYHNWVYNVKKLLVDYEFVDIFDNAHVLNTKSFPLVFKMKVIEMYKREWYDTLNKSIVMDLHKFFKSNFGYEMYLDVLPKSLRIFFSRLRMSVHHLRIQTSRYTNDNRPRNERYCVVCNSHDIEDEYHFICICPCYSNVRKQYIDKIYYVKPSVYKYLQLLTTVDKQELINISLVKHALLMRSNITYTER